MRTKYLNRVKESDFIKWYFDEEKDFFTNLGREVADELIRTGKYSTTITEIFESCPYLPSRICEYQFDCDEYAPHEVILIPDIS